MMRINGHLGLCVLLGAATVLVGADRAAAQKAGHAKSPHALPGNGPSVTSAPAGPWQLTVSAHGRRVGTYDIALADPSEPMAMNRKLADLGSLGTVFLVGYLPHAAVDYELQRDAADGNPAVRLLIEGSNVQVERWLIADDPNHYALESRIGRWVALSVRDPGQIARFLERKERKKQHNQALMVSTLDGNVSEVFSELEEGRTLELPDSDVTVKILRYMPWCSYDLEAKKIANLGDKPINPALEVEVAMGTETSTHLVFARQDADRMYQSATGIARPVTLRFHQRTSHAGRKPIFTIFVDPPDTMTVVTELGDAVNAIPLALGAGVRIPGGPLRFQAAEIVARAALTEQWRRTEKSEHGAAVRVRYEPGQGSAREFWISARGVKRVTSQTGFLEFGFRPPSAALPSGHPPTGARPGVRRPSSSQ